MDCKAEELGDCCFQHLIDCQRYLAEYSRAFHNVCEYIFTHTPKFIPLVYIGFDRSSTLPRWTFLGDTDKDIDKMVI